MRLYTSEKEAETMQAALSAYIVSASNCKSADTAQKLLAKIAKCLALQGIADGDKYFILTYSAENA